MSDPNDNNDIHREPMKQNPDDLQDSVEARFDNRFALLRLNSFNSDDQHQRCSTCGCTASISNSMKRYSPSPSSSFQDPLTTAIPSDSEPRPKKLFLDQDDLTLRGFSKLSLPVTLGPSAPAHPQSQPQAPAQPQFHPVLRRCASDPYNPASANAFVLPRMTQTMDPFAESGLPVPNPNPPQSPEHARTGVIQVTPPSNSGLPPLPPTLRRSVSDPTPSPEKTHSWSSSCGDASVGLNMEKTPNSKKRLRRMKDRMKEMSKWCEQVMREQEEEDGGAEDNHAATKDDSVPDFEESVFVERVGEGLTVRFKCPCGKGYQILLSGRDCYYKLM